MAEDFVQQMRNYDEWYSATPDPWAALARLEHGGDRTAATTVRSAVVHAGPAQQSAIERKLLDVLAREDATDTARMFVCRMLWLIGSATSVPALAALLDDARTADMARYALDAIDERAVDEAYRAALAKLSGAPKAGLIGSIALRGDGAALPAIEAIARDPVEDAAVRTAAQRAMERLTANERSAAP